MAIISGAYIIYPRDCLQLARDRPPNGETLREMQETFHQTAKRSAKCKRPSAKRRNAPRNARDLPPNGKTLREMQETVRQTANGSAKCKRPSAKWRNAPRNARGLSPNGETLREMQETVRQMAKCSAKCKRPSAKRQNAPRNARGGARSVGEGRVISSRSSPTAHPLNQMYCSRGGLCVGRRACRGCGASRRRGPGGRG